MPNYVDLQSKGLAEIEKAIQGSQGELVIAYKKALDDIRDEIAALYGKYAESGKLAYADVTKYNRLKNTFDSITGILSKSKIKVQNITGGSMSRAFREGYYLDLYITEMQTKSGIGFGTVSENAVNASVNLPQSGLTYIQTISKNFADSLTKVKSTITNGIIRGDSYRTMAGRIKDIFDSGIYDATRVIWTETHRTMVQGSLAAYDEAESLGVVSNRMWVSTLDSRTRPVKNQSADHRIMDGQRAGKDNMFTLSNGAKTAGPGLSGYADQDINCRCRVITIVDGYEPTNRRSKDQGVIPYMTYPEWKDYYGITA